MKIKRTIATAAASVAAIAALTGCGALDDDKDSCRTSRPMFFGTDGHYHYNSPSGPVVPAASVPKSAQKVPGYKAPAAPKVDLKKPDAPKAPAPKAPVAPAPRPAPKAGR